jgi:RNA polymerase sigma factor (sigma-70 family)
MNCVVSVFNPAVQGDMELIQQVVVFSDQQAFAELMQRHQSGVRRVLSRFNRLEGVTLDDLLQETFIKAFISISHFNYQAKFSTWLYRIAFNLAVDYSRKKTIDKCDLELAESIAENPIVNWELKTDLQKAMQFLNEQQKTAIYLCLSEGYSHVEAARKMGVPLGTVKTHVSRAKKILQQKMIHWQFAA